MPVPVISVEQMRAWENASWAAGKTAAKVIDQVGRRIAKRLESLVLPGEKILFLAGKGHNGDDARAAQKHLSHGHPSQLLNVTDPKKALPKLQNAGACSWIVDGLFGIGLNRPLDAGWQEFLHIVNNTKTPTVAVDVPSGLNAVTGEPEGAAISAEITLTIGAPKTGLLKAAKFTGRLEVLTDVGLIPCPVDSELNWTIESDFAQVPPRRPVESNKGTYGHLCIYAGSSGYHGAAVLAGLGAARAQPGLITIFPHESVYVPVAAQCQAIMVHAWREKQPLLKGCSAILFGPGLAGPDISNGMKQTMRHHWHTGDMPMVVDASALDWLQPGPTPAGAIRLITPHPGEAGRMLGLSPGEVQRHRVPVLKRLSRRYGNCFVVLKGNQTLVGPAHGKIYINPSGNPYLAQGGSGDLLGGFLAGLLAQPDWQNNPLDTIRYGVWQHGAAADALAKSPSNWTIEDLSRVLGSKNVS